ncbi:SsrA-binding protein, partial [Thermocrinis sp.]
MKKVGEFTVAYNKEAKAEYEIIETYEAGIVLEGSEVKALRNKQTVSFKDSFVRIENGEAWLHNLYIAPYRYATI